MKISRPWAFWRQVQYFTGFGVVFLGMCFLIYSNYFYVAASCFDNNQNGEERGVDCGGACARICVFDVAMPSVEWARSFRVTDGQYNAVAYVENNNLVAATPEISYTFSLYDADGLITERSGTTILPPDSSYPIFEGRITTGNRIPTQTLLDLKPAELWLPAKVGRNQFTIVDRNLQSADEQPRLDVLIANNELTEAKEVEVVATIFDANGNALTSSRTFVDEFLPREQREITFTWPEPIATTLRSCEVPTDVVVAIDLSGSMNNDQAEPPQPITSVLSAAESFVSRLQTGDQIGVVTFATEAIQNLGLTPSILDAQTAIQALSIDPEEEAGSTNTGEALLRATEELNSARHNADARKVAVLLTDGLATAPDEDPELYALAQASNLKGSGAQLFVIGLGEQVNMEFIRQLASEPTNAFQAINRNEVDRIYRDITGAICEDGAAIIDVVPKTKAVFE